MKTFAILAILSATLLAACGTPAPAPPAATPTTPAVAEEPTATPEPTPEPEVVAMLEITSTAFAEGETIPEAYRSGPIFGCDGEDLSPPLSWSGVPAGTQSLALIMADVFFEPPFVHWTIYNIPATSIGLAEGIPHEATLADRSRQGSLFGDENIGYFGPCPPPGESHTYLFRLYALDTARDFLAAGTDNESVLAVLEEAARAGEVLAKAELTATYTGQ